MNRLVCLTGASGAGKTTIAKACARPGLRVLHMDSIAVPSVDEMHSQFGGPEAWQRQATLDWMHRIAEMDGDILFEGQMRFAFLTEALTQTGMTAELMLIDCIDDARRARLAERGQPDLADQNMMNWAAYLRREAEAGEHQILDTSEMTVTGAAEQILAIFDE